MVSYTKKLEGNLAKYSWYKVFTKRLYLPLIAIQLVSVGKVTVEELAIIAGITSVVQLLLQVPAGYIADKWGNKRSIVFGALVSTVSPLFYIFMPNFYGGLIAAMLFFGGYAFQSGAIEAFMHDTLVALKREKDYSKVMGRAQSYGLIGNVLLITLVPASYTINANLPFVLGFISLGLMTWLTASFTYPKSDTPIVAKNPFVAARKIVNSQNVMLFIFAGVVTAVSNKAPDYRELFYQDIGIAVSLFGMLLAIGSILGAVMGMYVHVLDKLRPLSFYMFDLVFISLCLVVAGIADSQIVIVAAFALFSGYSRVRMIIFQSKLLSNIRHAYKATLLSALNIFTIVAEVGTVYLLARLIGLTGYANGHAIFGVIVLAIGLVLWVILLVEQRTNGFTSRKPAIAEI